MKSKNFSMGGGKGGSRQHHTGHTHGHPTAVGHGGDSGSMAEHGLSEGNTRSLGKVATQKQPLTPNLKEHELQHTDYGELTGSNYSD